MKVQQERILVQFKKEEETRKHFKEWFDSGFRHQIYIYTKVYSIKCSTINSSSRILTKDNIHISIEKITTKIVQFKLNSILYTEKIIPFKLNSLFFYTKNVVIVLWMGIFGVGDCN